MPDRSGFESLSSSSKQDISLASGVGLAVGFALVGAAIALGVSVERGRVVLGAGKGEACKGVACSAAG